MRYLVGAVLLTLSVIASSGDIDTLVEQLRDKDLSLETIAALVALDNPKLDMGYGLCEAAGHKFCKTGSSLGYGLCEVADGPFCKKDDSLGYGLCMLAGNKHCKKSGSLGYGLCELAGNKNCKP